MDVKAWDLLAEQCSCLPGGTYISITGMMRVSNWLDKVSGSPRYKMYIRANEIGLSSFEMPMDPQVSSYTGACQLQLRGSFAAEVLVGSVTRKIIYSHSLGKSFQDQSIQKVLCLDLKTEALVLAPFKIVHVNFNARIVNATDFPINDRFWRPPIPPVKFFKQPKQWLRHSEDFFIKIHICRI